jgi:hypothetical protein
LAVIIAATAAVVAPTAVWANDQFPDVPASDTHHDNINWLADEGITTGCGDGTNYCPSDPVTRAQMASFMRRLAVHLTSGGVHITRGAADAPVVDRFYNNVNSTAPTISGGGGFYEIDMGYDVSGRFVQCSVDTNFVDTRDALCTVSLPGGEIVRVRTFDTVAGALAPAEFFITVSG